MAAGGTQAKKRKLNKKDERRQLNNHRDDSKHGWFWMFSVFVLVVEGWKCAGVIACVLHRNHVAALFESDRHFSHLSDLEREMTFRTEMGLYFSYYKTLVEADSMTQGLYEITHDNVTEAGHMINTLKRFNLYPEYQNIHFYVLPWVNKTTYVAVIYNIEVFIAFLYRQYRDFAARRKWQLQVCYETNRGDNLPPIQSCEGMGNTHYFYVNMAFALAGTVAGSIFYYGVLLSDSIFGGLLALSAFAFNHGEATRVQWTPPLRETFGYPVFLFQMLIVSYVVKHQKSTLLWTGIIACLTAIYMMFWQFAQFSLSTVVGSLFVVYAAGFIDTKVARTVCWGLLLGFSLGFAALFGNEMLLVSLFFSSVITFLVILHFPVSVRWPNAILRSAVFVVIFAAGTIGIKFALAEFLNIEDDAHIFDILRAKFTDFENFDTRLYTCAVEFDFQPLQTYGKLTLTLLLPGALIGSSVVLSKCALRYFGFVFGKSPATENLCEDASLLYNVIQCIAYGLMALLIMRLKLFWTPHLCLCAATLASSYLARWVSRDRVRFLWHRASCVALIAMMAVQGWGNLNEQWNIVGEYSNVPLEQLLDWVVMHTPKNAVFAGTMPTMANLKLSTGRPIAMHPHYEDVGLRERVMKSYSVFSRKPPMEVYKTLKTMGIDYYIFEYQWCFKNPENEKCSIIGSFDRMDPENIDRQPFCDLVHNGADVHPFKKLYSNDVYTVLKLPDEKIVDAIER